MSPRMEPLPPIREVPPSTTAAMAFNSKLSPVAGCAASNWDAMIRPTTAAHSDDAAYVKILTRDTEIPASRAARSLPPTA